MKLFDLVKALFDRKFKWDEIKPYDKTKNFFMINRFMSINFPKQSNSFNSKYIDASSAIDVWKDVMNRLYIKVPSWMYTKTKKINEKLDKNHPSKYAILTWMKYNQLSKSDFDSLMLFVPDQTIKEVLEFEKNLLEKEKN